MAIIRTIAELKTYIGGAGNVSLSITDIQPFLDMVGQQHILPWLGAYTYEELEIEGAASPIAELLPYVQRPLALLTMVEYSKVNAIMISGAGNFRIEDDSKKTAYKYQENQYRSVMQEQGWESMERMLRYLDDNQNLFLAWKADARKRHKSLFLNYAFEFRELYGKHISRYIFEVLRPVMQEIEDVALKPHLGQVFFDLLKADILESTLTGKRKELVNLMQKAIVHFAIKEGIERNWVRFEGDRIVQYETLEPQGYQKASPAGKEETATLLRHSEEWGNRHIAPILTFLEANMDDTTFAEYKTFFEEQRDLATLSKLLCRKVGFAELPTLRAEYLDATGAFLPDKRHLRPESPKNNSTFIL